jgi:glutamyl-tRNA reductase
MAGSRVVERLVVVGANHRSSALSLRDQLFVEDAQVPAALDAMRRAGLGEALLLSTCDRVEIVALADDVVRAGAAALAVLARRAEQPAETLSDQIYTLVGAEAVRHLFAVAASLDSLMIGEPHVLGQVKAAHRQSRDAALSGPDLEALLQAAFAAAKRVRSETAIAEGPVSVASSAVQAGRDLFGDLASCRLLLAGGGDMGDLVTESFMAAGVAAVTVTARRASRAERLAQAYGAHILPYGTLAAGLAEAEVVVAAVGGRTWAVTEEAVKAALKKRRQRPILVIDAGIPGDVEAAVNRIDNAFLYDLEDLERLAEQGRAQREAAAAAAWAIIAEEVASFVAASAERAAAPAIAALHRRFEAERARALAEAHGDAEKATRLLVGRLLHHPSEALRVLGGTDTEGYAAARGLLRRLFDLSDDRENDG